MTNDNWVDRAMDMSLDELARTAITRGDPGSPNESEAMRVIQMRAAIEASKAAQAAQDTARATKRLAWATWGMTAATVVLAGVAVSQLLG